MLFSYASSMLSYAPSMLSYAPSMLSYAPSMLRLCFPMLVYALHHHAPMFGSSSPKFPLCSLYAPSMLPYALLSSLCGRLGSYALSVPPSYEFPSRPLVEVRKSLRRSGTFFI